MIQRKTGNLLAVERGIIVHGCNCMGVMGGGVALFIRNKWSDVYAAYRKVHETSGLKLGDTIFVGSSRTGRPTESQRHLHEVTPQLPTDVIVANAMTQFDYGSEEGIVYVDYQAVAAAFARIRMVARDTGLPVHFPLIGCGLAKGKWSEVSSRIEAALGDDIEATLWELPT